MSTIQLIPLNKIVMNRYQLADVKNEAKILEIAASLVQHKDNGTKGLLQVPTAREIEGGNYELAFGHHRLYAFLHNVENDPFFREMPLIVRELSDIEMFELMAIENFHRRDIGVMEEASTLHSYMVNFKKTSLEAAQKFEKTEEYVRGSIRLLNLPESAQKMVRQGTLGKSHARALLTAEKLGGAELVEEVIEEIESDGGSNPGDAIEEVIRMSNKTTYLDKDEGWFSSKKFPVKHLSVLTAKDLALVVTHIGGVELDSKKPAVMIEEMTSLISAGMEVTNEQFSMVDAGILERVRVLANPPQCEKCPIHAVFDGRHLCGFPQCKERKVKAWALKAQEDLVKKINIAMYQKSDGPYAELECRDTGDQKLFQAKHADLRLVPAQHRWNNFAGVGQNLAVVVTGETAKQRLKKKETQTKKETTARSNEIKEREKEREIKNVKEEFLAKFEWEVVSRAFEPMLDGITSLEFLIFNCKEMIRWHAEDTRFPEDVDEEEYIEKASEMKHADQLKAWRRLNMFHYADYSHNHKFRYYDGVVEKKKAILKYAENFQTIADEWGLKLPKDFMGQAAEYQSQLDAVVKGL